MAFKRMTTVSSRIEITNRHISGVPTVRRSAEVAQADRKKVHFESGADGRCEVRVGVTGNRRRDMYKQCRWQRKETTQDAFKTGGLCEAKQKSGRKRRNEEVMEAL